MTASRAARLAPLFAVLAYGWREAFVPLVVVAHNQHGAVLATAGLAVAASRIGSWLWARYGSSMALRPAPRAALVAALLLVFIGLAPEEGPLSLLLWAAFGFTWPIVQQALLQPSPSPPTALLVLLLGLGLAGPSAVGPGAWLMAAGYFFWSWQLGRGPSTPASPAPAVLTGPGAPPLWAAALPAIAMSTWLWLIPARLLAGGVPLAWCGVALALGNAPYALAAIVARPPWLLARQPYLPMLAAILLVPAVLALALAQDIYQIVALMAACSLLAGLLRGALDPTSLPWTLPAEGRAVGEVAGPLLGVLLLVVAGPIAVFGGAAVAAAASAGLLATRQPCGP
jgi:hypothetical protein